MKEGIINNASTQHGIIKQAGIKGFSISSYPLKAHHDGLRETTNPVRSYCQTVGGILTIMTIKN